MPQHIVYLSATRESIAYPNPDAAVIRCAQDLVYVSQTVVSAVAPFLTHTYAANRESKIIADDYEILFLDVLLLQPVADSLAAEIHVSGWFQENQFAASVRDFSNASKTVRLEDRTGIFSKIVHNHEADVVASAGIFRTDVSKSCYEIFSCHFTINDVNVPYPAI